MSITRIEHRPFLPPLGLDDDTDDDMPTVVTRPRGVKSFHYSELVAEVGGAATTNAARTKRGLDDLRDRFSGPYRVEGAVVPARPMFRMVTHEVPRKNELLVDALARAERVNGFAARVGQPSPSDLVRITQALIDAGQLPPEPGDIATRIRRMQWDFGIGIDCAGWCKEALLATCTKVLPLRGPGMESFRDLDTTRSRSFARIDVCDAQPGDLFTLDPLPGATWGHNVIVYEHTIADAANKRSLASLYGFAMRAFLATDGPHHVFEVDSSWGAGAFGSEHGGFRRDTWIYDASTKRWGWFLPDAPRTFVTADDGPADDCFHGAYRPR